MKNSPLRQAARWLSESGIQHRDRDPKLNGAVAAWYEPDKKLYPFLYSEITGYAISAWLFLNQALKTKKYLKNAGSAANWLKHRAAAPGGGVKTRFYLFPELGSPSYSFEGGRVYTFDTSMAGYGLLGLYRQTKDRSHLAAAGRIMDFLNGCQTPAKNGFYPYREPGQKKFGQDLAKWSDQPGSFHGKHALFYTDFYRITGDTRTCKRITAFMDAVVRGQSADGRFVTAKKDKSTHLHPHSYTLEGLLYAGFHLDREDYIDSALRGFQWMCAAASKNGRVASIYKPGGFVRDERSDIIAQLLRIGSILSALRPAALAKRQAMLQKVRDHLLSLQRSSADRRAAGGFIYSSDKGAKPHVNAWCTMFAMQALWMHEEFVHRQRPLILEHLI